MENSLPENAENNDIKNESQNEVTPQKHKPLKVPALIVLFLLILVIPISLFILQKTKI